MKKVILALFLLAANDMMAQTADQRVIDSEWVKVRSIDYNGAEDAWVRKGSDADLAFRKGLPHIHDTVYIDSFRNKVFALAGFLDRLKRAAPKQPYATQGQMGFFKFSDSGTWTTTRLGHARKKKKRRLPKPKTQWGIVTAVECPLDTVYGILIYNLKTPGYLDGDTQDSGYWVGCGKKVNVLPSGDYMMPGKYFRTDEYMDGHTEFKIVDNGKFYDMDDNHIGNYRVYGLIYTPKQERR